jgi:hypothetical protein
MDNRLGAGSGGSNAINGGQCVRSPSLDDRLEHLKALANRLNILQGRLTTIADGVRLQPSPGDKDQVRPEPPDLLGKFGAVLDYAGDRLIALEDLAQRLDAALFNHELRAPTAQCERLR